MAYNTSKGDRELGDIKNEDDPDTQIDFDSNSLTFRTDDEGRLFITNSHVSASVNVSASAFYGDGAFLQGITGSGGDVTGPGSSTATSIARFDGTSGKSIADSGITIDPGNNVSGMGGLQCGNITSQGAVSASAHMSASTFYSVFQSSFNGIDVRNGGVSNAGAITNATTISASVHVSSSRFIGDGSGLTNLPASGDVTGPGSSTATSLARFDGTSGKSIIDSGITVDPGNNVTGMGNLQCGNITSTGAVSASAHVSASAFVGVFESTFGSLVVGGASINDAGDTTVATLNCSNGGISNAGALSGVTTVAASGLGTFNELSSSEGIAVGGLGTLQLSGPGQGLILNTAGHLTVQVTPADKHLRLRLGDDAAATQVQVRNNSNNTVIALYSNGDISGSNALSIGGGITTDFGDVTANRGIFSNALTVNNGTATLPATIINSTLTASSTVTAQSFVGRNLNRGFVRELVLSRPNVTTITIGTGSCTDSSDDVYINHTASINIDITNSGINGLDTGAEAANTWYAVYLVSGTTAVGGLFSTSEDSPTMPAGFTYKRRIGWAYNHSDNDLQNFVQIGLGNERDYYSLESGADYNTVLTDGSSNSLRTAKDCSSNVAPTAHSYHIRFNTTATDAEDQAYALPLAVSGTIAGGGWYFLRGQSATVGAGVAQSSQTWPVKQGDGQIVGFDYITYFSGRISATILGWKETI